MEKLVKDASVAGMGERGVVVRNHDVVGGFVAGGVLCDPIRGAKGDVVRERRAMVGVDGHGKRTMGVFAREWKVVVFGVEFGID